MPKFNYTDEDLENLVKMAETRGQEDPYSAVNKQSGALGAYQLLRTYHKDPVEKRYNIPFEDITKYPEYQDDYFKNVLLPGYKKSTQQMIKTAPKNVDEFALTAMQQLGPGNVRGYLAGEADQNIKQQMEHFLRMADEYKRQRVMSEYQNKFDKLKNLMATQNRSTASESEE